jgi:hypothetical protein
MSWIGLLILHSSRAVTLRVILTLQHGGGQVTGVVGVDLKSWAAVPSVGTRRDRESLRALRYGGGSVVFHGKPIRAQAWQAWYSPGSR